MLRFQTNKPDDDDNNIPGAIAVFRLFLSVSLFHFRAHVACSVSSIVLPLTPCNVRCTFTRRLSGNSLRKLKA